MERMAEFRAQSWPAALTGSGLAGCGPFLVCPLLAIEVGNADAELGERRREMLARIVPRLANADRLALSAKALVA